MGRVIISPPELKAIYDSWGFSPSVLAGGFLFIGGQVGINSKGDVSDDPAEQIDQAFINMGYILREAGANYDDIVDLSAFYANYPEHSSLARAIREKHFGTVNPPNWTALGVADLASPFLFEAKATAYVGSQS